MSHLIKIYAVCKFSYFRLWLILVQVAFKAILMSVLYLQTCISSLAFFSALLKQTVKKKIIKYSIPFFFHAGCRSVRNLLDRCAIMNCVHD